jgi:hypothetical protein
VQYTEKMSCSHFSVSSSYNRQKKTSCPHHAKPTVCLSDYAMSAITLTEGSIQLHEQFYCDKKIHDAGRLDNYHPHPWDGCKNFAKSVHPSWQTSSKQDHHTSLSQTSSTDKARWIFGQVFMRPSYYSTDTSFIMMGSNILSGTDEAKATQPFE